MEKYTKFGVLSKSNSKGGKNFEDFSQLTPAGKRLTFVLINLALGGKPKDTLKWLKDHKIIRESHYNENFVHEVIRHWKISGEVFLKHHKVEGIKPLNLFFFLNGGKCNLTEVKWDAPIFE